MKSAIAKTNNSTMSGAWPKLHGWDRGWSCGDTPTGRLGKEGLGGQGDDLGLWMAVRRRRGAMHAAGDSAGGHGTKGYDYLLKI